MRPAPLKAAFDLQTPYVPELLVVVVAQDSGWPLGDGEVGWPDDRHLARFGVVAWRGQTDTDRVAGVVHRGHDSFWEFGERLGRLSPHGSAP
jgi:hypothetical protein